MTCCPLSCRTSSHSPCPCYSSVVALSARDPALRSFLLACPLLPQSNGSVWPSPLLQVCSNVFWGPFCTPHLPSGFISLSGTRYHLAYSSLCLPCLLSICPHGNVSSTGRAGAVHAAHCCLWHPARDPAWLNGLCKVWAGVSAGLSSGSLGLTTEVPTSCLPIHPNVASPMGQNEGAGGKAESWSWSRPCLPTPSPSACCTPWARAHVHCREGSAQSRRQRQKSPCMEAHPRLGR